MFKMLGAAVAAVVLSCAGAATWAMMILGFGAAGAMVRRSRHRQFYGA